jgi:hypothetical protein
MPTSPPPTFAESFFNIFLGHAAPTQLVDRQFAGPATRLLNPPELICPLLIVVCQAGIWRARSHPRT